VLCVKPLVWSLLLVIPVGAFGAEIYRSIGENGEVVYSDLPSTTGQGERVTVNVPSPGRSANRSADSQSSTSRSAASDSASSESAPGTLGAQVPRESTPEEIAADRAQNCEYARQMQATYSTAHRLYRNGPDGERVYLSDDELAAARTKAESDVAQWCD
jgi:cytoskeletal protein RodZ